MCKEAPGDAAVDVAERLLAALAATICPGECVSMHVRDGQLDYTALTTIESFANTWNHVTDGLRSAKREGRYLGIVHEQGATLIRLDRGSMRARRPVGRTA